MYSTFRRYPSCHGTLFADTCTLQQPLSLSMLRNSMLTQFLINRLSTCTFWVSVRSIKAPRLLACPCSQISLSTTASRASCKCFPAVLSLIRHIASSLQITTKVWLTAHYMIITQAICNRAKHVDSFFCSERSVQHLPV